MATRSKIAIKNQNGTVDAIYCHWDGYPEHNGTILQDCYDTEQSVRELLALGDLSSLGKTLQSTVAYHRDKGEQYSGVGQYMDTARLLASSSECGAEYVYLFENDKWECTRL